MARKTTVLTAEGKQKLKEELAHLRDVRRREVAERIHEAMELSGDPVDNSEYQDAKDEQARVEGRIRELEMILANAVVGTMPDSREKDLVQLLSDVTVEDELTGERETFVLVGATEADPLQGRISLESPVGRALLGHRVGDKVEVAIPAGVIRYKIVACGCHEH